MSSSLSSRPHPEALPHGDIEEIFPDIFFVTGTVHLKFGFDMSFSRNMTIVRDKKKKELILINSVRLDNDGLEELDKLGKVKHVIRLAGFHGMDDPFYKERYNCTVWGPKGAPHFDSFETRAEPYFVQDKDITHDTVLPISKSQPILIDSATPADALVLMTRPEGRILVSGDSLQNFAKPDKYFGCCSSIVMRILGFIKAYNVGPGWYNATKPDKAQLQNLLQLGFDHVLPSHGQPCIGQACQKYESAINSLE